MKTITLNTEPSKVKCQEVGNKAYNLLRVRERGFQVADGFILPISCFYEVMRFNHAMEQFESLKEPNDKVRFRERIHTFSFPEEQWLEIKHLVAQIGFPLIVRSSSTLEDGMKSSMAGMFLSVGNIEDEEGLRKAILEVWGSAFYNRVQDHQPLAILIQSYRKGVIGGVLFSTNPYGGNSFYGEYSEGGAEKTVDGRQNVPFELNDDGMTIDALWDYGKQLADTILALKKEFQTEVDMEWLINDQGLWILQVRPITALPLRRRVHEFLLVDAEDEQTLEQIDFEAFHPRYMKWYDKRMRLRKICKKNGIHVPVVAYVFYQPRNLRMDDILAYFEGVTIFKVESKRGIRTLTKNQLESFLLGLCENELDSTMIVRIQEITLTQACGNACMVGNQIYIECMPGGFGGFLTGELDFSRYLVDQQCHILHKNILRYSKVYRFQEASSKFEKVNLLEPIDGELEKVVISDIVDMVLALEQELPKAKVEFEVANHHAYFNDATLEGRDITSLDTSRRVLSKGNFEGNLVKMEDEALEEMKQQLGSRSVIAEGEFLVRQAQFRKKYESLKEGKYILAVSYPDPCLSVLLPFYEGFIFTRGGLLSHLAIILREEGKPAIIDEKILEKENGAYIKVIDGVIL